MSNNQNNARYKVSIMSIIGVILSATILVIGVVAYFYKGKELKTEQAKEVISVIPANKYEEIFSAIQNAYVSGGQTKDEEVPIDRLNNVDTTSFTQGENGNGDTVASYGNYIYYILNNSVQIFSTNNGEVTLANKMDCGNKIPIDIFIQDNKLIVISTEVITLRYEDGVSQNSTTNNLFFDKIMTNVEIFDLSNATKPISIYSFKQTGSYINSNLVNGKIYLSTNYANYQYKALDKSDDIANYIPSYYINDEEVYIAPVDIYVSADSPSTEYLILSEITLGEEISMTSTKAVLKNIDALYFVDEMIYTVSSKDVGGEYFTDICSFSLNEGIVRSAQATIKGNVNKAYSIYKSDDLRVFTNDKSGKTSVTVLNKDLTQIITLDNLCEKANVERIIHNQNKSYIYTDDLTTNFITVDFSNNQINVLSQKKLDFSSIFLIDENNSMLIKPTELDVIIDIHETKSNEILDIKFTNSIKLDDSYLKYIYSNVDRIMVDSKNGLIGIPVSTSLDEYAVNEYHLFKYSEQAVSQIGLVTYKDVDFRSSFKRAITIEDKLYIISDTRIVAVQASDMKVISTLIF